jgi:quinone-modifying oxidoreductase subunit QmoC
MENKRIIEPDTGFIKDLMKLGGESLKKCYQCSTCTVVCGLTPQNKPFPRKEMIWAQWGLKDRLIGDPDVWLCHQCTDCSDNCPRDAKPAETLAAIRSASISQLAFPHFLAKAFTSPKYLPAFLASLAVLMYLFLLIAGDAAFPQGEIVLNHMIPNSHAYVAMSLIVLFILVTLGVGGFRFHKKVISLWPEPALKSGSVGSFVKSFISAFVKILTHSNFAKCDTNKFSRYSHLGIFYGAILLLLAAFLGAVYHLSGIHSPYALDSPVKIAGNLGGLLLIAGLIIVIYRRLSSNSPLGQSTYSDWLLVSLLLLVSITGIATTIIRLSLLREATYWMYLVHLWLMFALLVYGPFSKGAHIFYRTLAMTYAQQIGREAETPAKS